MPGSKPKTVKGAGGASAPPGTLAGSVTSASGSGSKTKGGVQPCPLEKHWIKVRLRYKDDKSNVPATPCSLTQGERQVADGPVADGSFELKHIPGGMYEVSFPDIDASEWDLER